jgi:ABC-type Fe3+ transport system permease subunit
MKWKWILPRAYLPTLMPGLVVAIGSITGNGDKPCNQAGARWISWQLVWCTFYCAFVGICILRITWKLWHHGRDNLGIKKGNACSPIFSSFI